MSASSLYLRLRSGKAFLIGLIVFCGCWATWNLTPGLPHWDNSDLAILMMILSVEASVNGAALAAQNERAAKLAAQQDQREERQLRYLGSLLEGQSAMMKALRDRLLSDGHDADASAMAVEARSTPAGGCQQPPADGMSMREHSSIDQPTGGAHVAALGGPRADAGDSVDANNG